MRKVLGALEVGEMTYLLRLLRIAAAAVALLLLVALVVVIVARHGQFGVSAQISRSVKELRSAEVRLAIRRRRRASSAGNKPGMTTRTW